MAYILVLEADYFWPIKQRFFLTRKLLPPQYYNREKEKEVGVGVGVGVVCMMGLWKQQ